jgi:ribosomal protein L30
MNAPVRSLFVTLRRSLANTREQHVRVIESLGLRRREQTVEKPNNAAIRGAIDKVGGRQVP